MSQAGNGSGWSQAAGRTVEVSVGDYVSVTSSHPDFLPASGVVVARGADGFSIVVLGGPAQPAFGPIQILWENVARFRVDTPPASVVRVYTGEQQSDTTARLQAEMEALGRAGYRPTTQSWAQGQWGCGAWLVALLLCVLLIGLLVFLYMLIVKPDGTLTVTFAHDPAVLRPSGDPPASVAPVVASSTLVDRLSQIEAAREAGLLTEDEYAQKRSEIISSH